MGSKLVPLVIVLFGQNWQTATIGSQFYFFSKTTMPRITMKKKKVKKLKGSHILVGSLAGQLIWAHKLFWVN